MGSKKSQIQTLRNHIEKSNRITYIIIRVSSPISEKKLRKFPRVVWMEEGGFLHNSKNFEYPNNQLVQKTDIQIQTLRDHIKKSEWKDIFFLL